MNHRLKAGLIGVLIVAQSLLLTGCEKPDQVMLADGRGVQFDHWDGRWLVINYWAEWCAPCRKEIPELNRLHAERASSGVVVLGVNYDDLRGEKLAALVSEMGIEFPVLVEDPRFRWSVEQPAVLPSTLIINPEGEVQQILVGPQHYEDFQRVIGFGSEEDGSANGAKPAAGH